MDPRPLSTEPAPDPRADIERLTQALEQQSRILDVILERTAQGLMLVNADRVVEVCNQRAIELMGLPADLMRSRPTFEQVLAYQWSTDEFVHTPDQIQEFVRAGGILDQPQTYERTRPDGRVVEVLSVPLEGGGVLRTYTDITARRRAEDRIRYRARHDGLTALVNRETFLESLDEAIAAAHATGDREGFAVHYLDLDGFKPVNDAWGHAVGDQVLAWVALQLGRAAREDDVVARMGGDEFAVLERHINAPEQVTVLANRMLEAIAQPFVVEGHDIRIGASVGIAIYPLHGAKADQLIRHADAALYGVKSDGGRGVRIAAAPNPV